MSPPSDLKMAMPTSTTDLARDSHRAGVACLHAGYLCAPQSYIIGGMSGDEPGGTSRTSP